jgi:KAP family P-loop domain
VSVPVRTRISRKFSRKAAPDLPVKQKPPLPSDPFQILSDVPTGAEQRDYLRFARYADALAFIIDQKDTSTPLVMAISAPWGAGKTTLANLVEEQLGETVAWNERHVICRFNAWKHDDASNLGSAFAADVANRANTSRHWWRKVFQPLPSSMLKPEQRWRRRLWIIVAAVIVAMSIVLNRHMAGVVSAAIGPTDQKWANAAQKVPGFSAIFIIIFAFTFLFPKVYSGMRSVARFIDDPGAEAARGSIDSVRDELGKLIRGATRGHRRFVIFVDDLERCRPPRAVEVCEVASQLLNHPDVVTIFVADMDTIAKSAAIKYRELEVPNSQQTDTGAYEQYGRAYLQKLVQIEFDLPAPSPTQLQEMLVANRRREDSKSRPITGSSGSNADNSASSLRDAGLGRVEADQKSSFHLSSSSYIPILILSIPLLLVALQSSYVMNDTEYYIFTFLVAGFGLLVAIAAALQGYITVRRENQRRELAEKSRERIDEKIKKLSWNMTIDAAVDEIFSSQDDRSKETEKSNFSKRRLEFTQDTVSRSYIRRRIFDQWLKLLQEREVTQVIDNLVYSFLPERPRAAKRLLNQVRLMTVIALSRNLLRIPDGRPERQQTTDKQPEEEQSLRTARRVFNQVRLMTVIALSRNLLRIPDGQPERQQTTDKQSEEQQATRLGKWLVLLERWPTVAEFMEHHRDQITELEHSPSLKSKLTSSGISGVDDIEDLRRLLSLPPPFGNIDELVLLGGSAASSLRGAPS